MYAFYITMKAKLVCYKLKADPAKRTKLHKELYGYKDYSNHGDYTYKRSGLLNTTQSKRITDAVILIENRQATKLIELLHKYGAQTYVFNVTSPIRL